MSRIEPVRRGVQRVLSGEQPVQCPDELAGCEHERVISGVDTVHLRGASILFREDRVVSRDERVVFRDEPVGFREGTKASRERYAGSSPGPGKGLLRQSGRPFASRSSFYPRGMAPTGRVMEEALEGADARMEPGKSPLQSCPRQAAANRSGRRERVGKVLGDFCLRPSADILRHISDAAKRSSDHALPRKGLDFYANGFQTLCDFSECSRVRPQVPKELLAPSAPVFSD
jgi:hypothetical protein